MQTLVPAFLSFALLAFATIPASSGIVEKFDDPSRVVAIGGSITEIVFALEENEHLIARDSTAVFPPAALDLPDVGYMRALSPEGVLSINPSAMLMLEGSGPPEAVEVLKKASVPMVVVPERFDAEGILAKVRTVGRALGVADKAERLAEKVRLDLETAQGLTDGIAERRRVLFILSNQGGRLLAAGTDTAAHGIIEMAGAVNAMSGFSGYKQLADEAIIGALPDLILMMNARSKSNEEIDAELLAHPAIAATPAGKAKAILHMDGAYLLGFGPRTASAVRELAVSLYGEAIAD